jgi:N-acetylneuraminic acid mutarotase
MRRWFVCLVVLCGCHELFSLDEVGPPPLVDGPPDAVPDAPPPVLGKWEQATGLPAGRDYNYRHAAFVNDTLFIIGGFDAGETTSVLRAPVVNGTLGTWTATASLPAPRAVGDVVTIGSRIYAIGGANGGAAQISVYVGESDAGGSIASWSAAPELPAPRKAHGSAVANGHIYVVGGGDDLNKRVATVYFAAVDATGKVAPWQTTVPLPAPRANHATVAARGFLYAIGGDDADPTNFTNVYYTALDPVTGQATQWNETTPLPIARKDAVAVTDGLHIYIIGGVGTAMTSEVRYTTVAEDGTLSPWDITEPILMPRFRHAAVLGNGQLFVLGGAGAETSVEHAWQGP